MASRIGTRRRSVIRRITLGVVAVVVSLEIGLRIFDAARDRSWNARTSWFWLFEPDSYLGHRGRADVEVRYGAGVVRHNADGFRDARELRDIAAIPEHRLVVCVGDSSTYGTDAPDVARTYPARLEEHLRETTHDDRWFVFNAGVPGYTSREATQLLALKILNHRPAAVLMMSLYEDAQFVATRLNEATDYAELPRALLPEPSTWLNALCMRSALYGWFASRAHAARSAAFARDEEERDQRDPIVTPQGRAFYLDNLALAAQLCRRAGVPLLMVDPPTPGRARADARERPTSSLREALKAACAENAVPLLDGDTRARGPSARSDRDADRSGNGYDRLAQVLAPQVLQALLPVKK